VTAVENATRRPFNIFKRNRAFEVDGPSGLHVQ
jgi:hypothetical protein